MGRVAGDQFRTAKYRMGGIAMFDLILTILAAALATYVYKSPFDSWFFVMLLSILIIAAIPIHVLVDQPTQLNYYLGLSPARFNTTTQKIWESNP
jgi:hypothetical protein